MDLARLAAALYDPELEYMISEQRLGDAFRALVEYRRKHLHFMKKPIATVLVPRCEDCFAYERHVLDDNNLGDGWRPPDVRAGYWEKDLREYGLTRSELRRIKENGSGGVHCHECGRGLTYGVDNVYVESQPFEVYFDELLPSAHDELRRSAPKWMKRLVFEAYKGRCFGCKEKLRWSEKSTDHIQPWSRDGKTELQNLQLLCRECDGKRKRDSPPEEEYIWFHSPLVPPPSDAYEGFVW